MASVTNPTPQTGGGQDYLNITADTVLQSYITNVKSNGGSISEQYLAGLKTLLVLLQQLNLLSKVTYFNPALGNNWQAFVTNVINVSGVTYATSTSTIDDSWCNVKTGWTIPSGSTLNTGYNPSGQTVSGFITCQGFSDNFSSNNKASGTATHSLLKLSDTGMNYYLQGRGILSSAFNNLSNAKGNHIIYQSSSVNQWYIDGVLHTSNTVNTAATFPSSNFIISSGNTNTYNLYINSTLTGTAFAKLAAALEAFNNIIGRQVQRPVLNTMVVEGTSLTASYGISPTTYYISKLISNLNLTSSQWAVGQLAVSGKLQETMLTDATSNTGLYNTNNFTSFDNNVFIFEPGPNSMGAASGTMRTADDLYYNVAVPLMRNRIAAGYTVVIETMPPSTNYYASLGGNPAGNANYNSATTGAKRYNFLIKSDPNNYNGVNAYGVILTDEIPQLQDYNNTTYFQDTLHYTAVADDLRAVVVTNTIKKVISKKSYQLIDYSSDLIQIVTTAVTGSRDYKNYFINGGSFTVPDAQQFFNMEYMLKNTGSVDVNVSGGYTSTLSPGSSLYIKSNGITWSLLTRSDFQELPYQILTANTNILPGIRYYINPATNITLNLTLPTTFKIDDSFIIFGKTGTFKIIQNANQIIRSVQYSTTLGATGSLLSTNQYCTLTMRGLTANTELLITTMQGTFNPA